MATLTINLLELARQLAEKNATPQQINTCMKELENRIADWGRQFPESSFHERRKMRGQAAGLMSIVPGSLQMLERRLELGGIPEEVAVNFYRDVFPELPEYEPALPPRRDWSDDE